MERIRRWRARRRFERRWPLAKTHPDLFIQAGAPMTLRSFNALQTAAGLPATTPEPSEMAEAWHAILIATARPSVDVIDADIWNAVASYVTRRP